MLDVSTAILDNSFKTSTTFIDTVINETLWEFLPLGDSCSLQLFHRLELSLVVDSRLAAEEHPKQRNPRDLYQGYLEATCEVQWSWCALCSDSPSWSGRCAQALHPARCVDLYWRHIALMSGSRPFSKTILQYELLTFAPESMKTTLALWDGNE